jgi:Vitamin B12 dependent methionine synthase, activation domain
VSAGVDPAAAATLVLLDLPVRIDRDEVLRYQGYKKGIDLPTAEVQALLEQAVKLGESLMAARLVYRAVPVTGQGPDWIEAGGERLTIPAIGRLWGRLERVGAGICTVGPPVETRVRSLFDAREFPLAVMLDSVGSAAVESVAEYANDLLCQRALESGLRVTNRISPGYAGWDTAEQRALFRLCPGEPIEVALNEACVMTPAKTISFLVGVGPEALVDHYFTQCRRCWMAGCAYRRAPAPTTVHR